MPTEMEKLTSEDWSNLIQGILFNFKITEEKLGRMIQVSLSSISSWLNQKCDIPSDCKLKILSLIERSGVSVSNLIDIGKKVKNSILFNNTLVDKTNSVKRSQLDGDILFIRDNRWFLNTPLLFPLKCHGNDIKFIFQKEFVIVFFENKNKENPQPLKLPKLISVNEDFLVGLGIWIAEGTKTKRNPKVANSEPVIIQQAIKFFEHIGISKKKLSGWVQIHPRSPFKNNEDKLKEFWCNVTGFGEEQIKDVRVKKDRGERSKVRVKEMGTFHLGCDLILSRLLVEGLLLNVEKIIEAVTNSELPFLKGIVAGEGWCGQTKQGVANEITITLKEERWRKLVLDLLLKLGIKAKEHKEKFQILICGFKNLKKLNDLNIFQFLPEMKKRLEDGILLSKYNISLRNKEKIIQLLKNSKTSFTSKEISELLGMGRSNVNSLLKELLKENKISCTLGRGKIPHKWYC
jgi:transcriptional regulator with XRE-family HTH domain/DNA-binding CsgD family transcriptional regulator